jgi:hypothetical protein
MLAPQAGSQLPADSKVGFDNETRRLLAVYLYDMDTTQDPDRATFQRFMDVMQAGKPKMEGVTKM